MQTQWRIQELEEGGAKSWIWELCPQRGCRGGQNPCWDVRTRTSPHELEFKDISEDQPSVLMLQKGHIYHTASQPFSICSQNFPSIFFVYNGFLPTRNWLKFLHTIAVQDRQTYCQKSGRGFDRQTPLGDPDLTVTDSERWQLFRQYRSRRTTVETENGMKTLLL